MDLDESQCRLDDISSHFGDKRRRRSVWNVRLSGGAAENQQSARSKGFSWIYELSIRTKMVAICFVRLVCQKRWPNLRGGGEKSNLIGRVESSCAVQAWCFQRNEVKPRGNANTVNQNVMVEFTTLLCSKRCTELGFPYGRLAYRVSAPFYFSLRQKNCEKRERRSFPLRLVPKSLHSHYFPRFQNKLSSPKIHMQI